MSTSGQDRPFADGFMDDYFAEADEHMVAVRRSLMTLESALGSTLPSAALEDLFRSFHSLKGISAMVELREAELLAHHMESCLRAVRQGDLTLTTASFEILVDGVRMLEHVIASRRASTPQPSVDAVVEKLDELGRSGVEASRPAALTATDAPNEPSQSGAQARLLRVTFVPSPQLVERGVKVDTVRARLMQIGEVRSVTPKVLPGGGISFEFVVQTSDASQLAQWKDDGLTYEPLEAATAVEPRGAEEADAAASQERRLTDLTLAGSSNVVRVDLARLDELMRLVGDMVVTRSRLEDTLRRVEAHVPFQEWRALQDHSARLERNLRDLREGVMRVRLVPVGEIFRRMPFVVRDLARDSGKRVHLELTGQGTEIDKFLVERMMDPVLHLVRNAISHGIETPDAAHRRGQACRRHDSSRCGDGWRNRRCIEIADDGRGIDTRVGGAARALARSASCPTTADSIRARCSTSSVRQGSRRATKPIASAAAVSAWPSCATRSKASAASWPWRSKPGHGTTFRLTLPLTLAITDAIIAHVGDQIFAVPQTAVREVVEVDASRCTPSSATS